jgi:hypothetical protein
MNFYSGSASPAFRCRVRLWLSPIFWWRKCYSCYQPSQELAPFAIRPSLCTRSVIGYFHEIKLIKVALFLLPGKQHCFFKSMHLMNPLSLQPHIQGVLGWGTCYPDWGISRILSAPRGKCHENISLVTKQDPSRYFPIHHSSYHSNLYSVARTAVAMQRQTDWRIYQVRFSATTR